MSRFLAKDRRRFLQAAVEDTLRWCARPDASVIGNHPTDQYWIGAFASDAPPIDVETASDLLASLKIGGGAWNYATVARSINSLRNAGDFLAERDIPTLAETLRRAQRQDVTCTAAASKLALFMFPAAEIYVWHDLAVQALISHEQQSIGNLTSVRGLPDDLSSYCYRVYHAACRRTLDLRMTQPDFVEAAQLVTGLLRAVPGPLSEQAVPDAFFPRYLLGKLLFHEGWLVKYGQMAHGDYRRWPS